jgi:hypothetical protein
MSTSYETSSAPQFSKLQDAYTSTMSQPSSPSPDSSFGEGTGASAYLRAEQTLQELANQLSGLGVSGDDVECVEGCNMAEKLALSAGVPCITMAKASIADKAEVGAALLQRCEAQEKKHEYEMKRLQRQVSSSHSNMHVPLFSTL